MRTNDVDFFSFENNANVMRTVYDGGKGHVVSANNC